MNLSLLDEQSRVVSRRWFSRGSCRKIASLPGCRVALRRGLVWLNRNLWRKPILTITSCWRDSSSPPAPTSNSLPYHRLHHTVSEFFVAPAVAESVPSVPEPGGIIYGDDTVLVKVGIVGDWQTGKTSLMENFVAGESRTHELEAVGGVNSMDKLLDIHSVKIALSIWDLGGCKDLMTPVVCKDAAAILILFDLTRRTTLHSVKQWFVSVRQSNKVALPVLVGTKFDQFIMLPENLKSLITKQARVYAQAMGAPLLFTSIPYNINVNKLFKIVLARIFDLPCKISRNLNLGEPLVDY